MQTIEFPAADGFLLSAFLAEPKTSSKGVILLCTGLGIPKEFYKKYVAFLSEQGYTALVFDYRGINLSKDKAISEEVINLRNWGSKDMVGAVTWLKDKYPQQALYLFGHSIGGQVAGLMENYKLIDRYIFFCSTTGHYTAFGFPLNIFTWFMFQIHIPITTRLFGYMPQSLTYRGVSIAKGVALEWARWSRQRDYIRAFFGKSITSEYYADISQSIDWIYFTDDPIATKKAVGSMLDYYPNAPITPHLLNPSDLNLPRIGHSGFFTSKGISLWKYPLDLLEKGNVA